VPIEKGARLVSQLNENPPRQFAGQDVDHIETLDGTKLVLSDESWILFRQSGTEPLLRIYCEATSEVKMTKLMDEGERMARV
jgi:phosphomannomutase